MATYVFSWDGKESWPLMPDTEFNVDVWDDELYCVFMRNPSRAMSDRNLPLLLRDTEEQAIKELRELVESILGINSGADTPSPFGALLDAYARR